MHIPACPLRAPPTPLKGCSSCPHLSNPPLASPAADGLTTADVVAVLGLQGFGLWTKQPGVFDNSWFQTAYSTALAGAVRFSSTAPSYGGQLVLATTLFAVRDSDPASAAPMMSWVSML